MTCAGKNKKRGRIKKMKIVIIEMKNDVQGSDLKQLLGDVVRWAINSWYMWNACDCKGHNF